MEFETPCAACKSEGTNCTKDCVLAPYFSREKFECANQSFSVSSMIKILNEVPYDQRQNTANSLYFEALTRLRDPVYGTAGLLMFLRHEKRELEMKLNQTSSDQQQHHDHNNNMLLPKRRRTYQEIFEASLTEEKKEMFREQVKLARFYGGYCSENPPPPLDEVIRERHNELFTQFADSDCEERSVTDSAQ